MGVVNKARKEPRTVTTVNLDNRIIEWMRSRPRSFSIQDWVNETLRRNIKTINEAEKKTRMLELETEIKEKTAALAGMQQEEAQKQSEVELKAKAEAAFAIEQQEKRELQGVLDYFAKQSDDHKKFLAKLEWQIKDSLPKNPLARLRALRTALDNACIEGEGLRLMEQLKEKVV